MLPGANPIQAPWYEEYVAMYMPAVLEPLYVLMKEGILQNLTTEVVVLARMLDGGGSLRGCVFGLGVQ